MFALDGTFARCLNRIGDLIWLNVLALACSLPLVTAGAAFSALYQVTLKMVRNEEGRLTADYFHALKSCWKQSTAIWVPGSAVSILMLFDIRLLGQTGSLAGTVYQAALFAMLCIVIMTVLLSLIVEARFENTLANTVRNGILFGMVHPLRSLLMFAVMLLPVVLLGISLRMLPLVVLVGMSGPAYLTSFYFRDLFQNYGV